MAILQTISIKESKEELTALLRKSTAASKPRIKMSLAILDGITSTQELVLKTRANRESIRKGKNRYRDHGLESLIKETRGRKKPGAIGPKEKLELQKKLSDPKGGFTSYKQAREWINSTFGLNMEYHAVNKYLKRNNLNTALWLLASIFLHPSL